MNGPNGQNNGSFSHLIEQLDARLARIEHTLDRLADDHSSRHKEIHTRVTVLEMHKAENAGSWKTLTLVSGGIATVAGIATSYLARMLHG
jgi:hypothetical protein